MSFADLSRRATRHLAVFAIASLSPSLGASQGASGEARPNANWELSNKFGTQALQRVTYSSTLQPRWIGKTDSMWYNWRSRQGTAFMLVYPPAKVKRPLFDHVKLAAALATAHQKPYEPNALPFTTLNFTRDHKAIRFTVDSTRYEWNLSAETIRNMGRPLGGDSLPPDEERQEGQQGGRGGGGGGGRAGGAGVQQDFRNFSPDSTAFVFAMNHNLYVVEVGKPDTVRITNDGVRNYSFGFRDTATVQQQDNDDEEQGGRQGGARARDPRVRANVTWSPDSRAFFILRNDSRKVRELYLVNVLAEPRPALSSYTYAMPGEENVSQQELHVYRRGEPAAHPVNVRKWRDQRLLYTHWTTGSSSLRLVRRDRPQRQLEMIEVDLASGASRTLLTETIVNANLESQAPRYVRGNGDLIWWSERAGWGHYYLYDHHGAYKRPLTSGPWRADQIAQIDTVAGVIWVGGVGREPGENPYYRHLYRVNADGSGFTLIDAGDFNHAATISPTRKYVVDNYSRVNAPTRSVVRDGTGAVVMDLESTDVSSIAELGWRPPEPFVVKAADGVTDIYGNMWKPFDFDSTRKYPIVAHVYPGPQTEQVNTTFNAGGVQQQLAQLGFIVIQIGNRGGSPLRSNAYQNFSYNNLRDYALADKKAGIEQLAARHAFIDLNRVGIYGHSGGGFLTAAALMLPPYNDFFKVGVSSSGNHDNNIYNQNWSEQYHGLRAASRQDSTRRVVNGRAPVGNGNGSAVTDTGFVDDTLRYEIKVPTNIELAPNLKGRLLLATGDMDNNVHPGGTIRLVNALIKANKRFDFLLLPGKAHGFADYQPYFHRMLMEYFAEHLLGDNYRRGAEIR
jgi:dipeptidyl aminopeptidase/acylaminoacyl peptidase